MSSSSASLLALKAELQRAEERARKNGAASSSGSSYTKLTLKTEGKNNSQNASGSAKSKSTDKPVQKAVCETEDSRIIESRKKLEQKARIYEEMQVKARESIANADSDDDEADTEAQAKEHPLVDFEQKALLDFAYEREKERRNAVAKPSSSKSIHETLRNPKFESITDADSALRTRLHSKWERDEEQNEAKLSNDGSLHYQDVRFDEIRELGTGYFAFARDSRTRTNQQEELRTMHEETETTRRKHDLAKLEREQALRARLAAVKRLRLSRNASAKDDESSTDDRDSGDNSDGSSNEAAVKRSNSSESDDP